MSTEQRIEAQIGEYFGWLERELGPVAVAPPTRVFRRRRSFVLVAATLALLVAGVVAIAASGRDGSTIGTEVPAATGWRTFPAPPLEPRWAPVSIGTGDGWFVWGGVAPDNTSPDTVEPMFDGAYYDGTTGEWRLLPEAPVAQESAQGWSAVWTGREVVIVQGYGSPKVAAFDIASFTWRAIDVPDEAIAAWARSERSYSTPHAGVVNGRIVLFGAGNPEEGQPATMLLLDPSTDTFTTTGPTPTSMNSLLGPFAASDEEFFVIGGSRRNSDSTCADEAKLYRFDVAALRWSEVPLPDRTANPGFVAVEDGRVLVGGGTECDWSTRTDAWALSPDTAEWERLDDLPVPFEYPQGEAVTVDRAVAITGPAASTLLFWPQIGTWSVVPSPVGPSNLELASFGGRLVAWGVGRYRPGPQDGTSTCCRPDPSAYAYVPSAPTDGAPGLVPVATVPGTYQIRVGDDVAGVAARLCVTVEELSAANRMNTMYDAFLQGAELAVPAPAIDGCTPDLAPPRLPAYEVRIGDTPSVVAARLCVTIEELAAVNAGFGVGTRLLASEGLAVPPASAEGCTPDTRRSYEVTAPSESPSTYAVVEGDNPERVAARLCVTLDELDTANTDNEAYARFLIGDLLVAPPPSIDRCATAISSVDPNADASSTSPVGPATTAPGTYAVVAGDDPESIAAKLCVSAAELTTANADNDAYRRFLVGDVLVVPAPSIAGCTPTS